MAYNTGLLDCFNKVPHFKENTEMRRISDDSYLHACRNRQSLYFIVPVGQYFVGENPSKMERVLPQLRNIIISLGSCLAGYGIIYSSPLATTLGFLPLTFGAKLIGQKFLGLVYCPMAISGLCQKLPEMMQEPFIGEFLKSRQIAHSCITSAEEGFNCSVTNISIMNKGTKFDSYFISWVGISNTAWVVHALDGTEVPGWPLLDYPVDYWKMMDRSKKFNHVIIAGPSVGYSSGWPTPENIGDGYAGVIQLLKQVGATHIVMEARGLFGGLTLTKAIESLDFTEIKEKNIYCLAVSISTANSVSELFKHRLGLIAENVIKLYGMDINSDKMNRKLEELKIEHIVIGHDDPQSPFDGPVSDEISLYKKLKEKNFSNVTLATETKKLSDYSQSYWDEVKGGVLKEKLYQFLEQS